ncbi:hypothetical protein ABB37_03474 [Leptomonas pyrrhocoris]|uniref:Uncharacterized protein n=1 Tax=Leptomonas pyrrhocoris TaxID=157538 RepID=A0A0N0VG70_LEPPY|nr:hypothetical protein ABB37_03474 [Leptomonas pyrrhocoris]KPA82398.1 hypothetical protein ABB37_03474 [Leptomonas pyrrhocoris]|eukprot:XP_015660837.1 hypothetical protein ABB37_03474 [Leptomonas pyrrhocoris]
MESPAVYCACDTAGSSQNVCDEWWGGLTHQRRKITQEVAVAFDPPPSLKGNTSKDAEEEGTQVARHADTAPQNMLRLHAMHRRRLYKQYALDLSYLADTHAYYQLMMWCHDHHVFIHPSVEMTRHRTAYREHVFRVKADVAPYTPLLAIPENLVIGFKDANTEAGSDGADGDDRNNLYDAKREAEFHKLNTGDNADTDICQFFFASLGMIVSDLITARSSPLTDPRFLFAELLGKVSTLQNAPYFEDDVVFDPNEPGLADILLQMIRNYVNGGPLVNKVPPDDLRWAVSLSLSHSTPLSIGAVRSIGIVPVVHLFPHGGTATNTYIVARTARDRCAEKMNAFFRHTFHYDFQAQAAGKWIFVVPERALKAGEEICLQAMAPVCEKDSEAAQMWRLSCGTAPESYLSSADVYARQAAVTDAVIRQGEALWKADRAAGGLCS